MSSESIESLRLSTGRAVRARVMKHASAEAAPNCILVHGNPGTSSDWARLSEPLARVANVATLDLPGFGASPRPGSEPTLLDLDHLAADVLALGDALGFAGPLLLVGHSHGGGVVQIAATLQPQKVRGIVLLGTLGPAETLAYRLLNLPGAWHAVRAAAQLGGWRALRVFQRQLLLRILQPIFHPEPVPPERLEQELQRLTARPEILRSMVDLAQGQPSRQLARNAADLPCPVLVIHGARDALVPLRHATSLHQAFLAAGVRSELVSLPGAGHQLQHFQADAIAELVLAFCASLPSGSVPAPRMPS